MLGPLPTRIVIGFVDCEHYNGKYELNPFNFQNHKISKLSVSVDGENALYSPVELNFANNMYIKGYYSLFSGLDRAGLDSGNHISRTDYKDGYCLFAFDFTPDMCEGDHFNLIKSGNLRINVTFSDKLDKPINCIVYMCFENILEINKNRNIIFDYKI